MTNVLTINIIIFVIYFYIYISRFERIEIEIINNQIEKDEKQENKGGKNLLS